MDQINIKPNLIDQVRYGMSSSESIEKAAQLANVPINVYRFIRQLLQLKAHRTLSNENDARIDQALQMLNDGKGIKDVSSIIGQILKPRRDILPKVRQAVEKQMPIVDATKFCGVSHDTYSFLRKLIVLRQKGVLTNQEEAKIDSALALIERRGRYTKRANEQVKDIIAKYWERNSSNGVTKNSTSNRLNSKRRKRLEKTIFAIGEACSNNDELEIPIMSRNDRHAMREMLLDSANDLWKLIDKLKLTGETQ